MTGDGILKTTTAITTGHTASEAHGTGADITIRTTARGDIAHIGTDGVIATGATTDIMIHGITTLGTTIPDGTDGMTHGTTEGIMVGTTHGTTEATMAGTTRITATTSTMDGTTHITTTMALDT